MSRELTEITGNDEWTAWQFDNAVTYLGIYIENKLNELDKKGKPKYKLDDLLISRSRQRRKPPPPPPSEAPKQNGKWWSFNANSGTITELH